MQEYYLLYYNPLRLFLRTPEGRFEHTMKEIKEESEYYKKDKDKCPDGDISKILTVIKAKDILLNTQIEVIEETENAE